MKKDVENRTKAIMALAKAYEENNVLLTTRVESILIPSEVNLPDELKEKLQLIKTTPIEEPELQSAFESENSFAFRTTVCKKLDVNVDDYDATVITELTIEALKRFRDKMDEDGMFKTTPNLTNMKLPKTSQLQEMMEMIKNKELTQETFLDKIFEIGGIKREDLTEWEKELVDAIFGEFIKANNDSYAMRQAIDKTPFSRYLKN